MHRVGMLHGDLKWDNIMVANEPALENVRLVDLDGSSASAGCNLPRARKEFDRFLRDLERAEKEHSSAQPRDRGMAKGCDVNGPAWGNCRN